MESALISENNDFIPSYLMFLVSGRSDFNWHIFSKIGLRTYVWFLTGDLEDESTQIRETNQLILFDVQFQNLGKI